jgi:hypothetical protein
LRVLFISGYPAEALREREARLPASIELLQKPFAAATLVAKARQILAEQVVVGAPATSGRSSDGVG